MGTALQTSGPSYEIINAQARSGVVLVCEHASNSIPDNLRRLGLTPEVQNSHVGWDPGALPVARHLARALDAPLVAGTVSRLVYDCNRPPDAAGAMPARSEVYDIPGNANLDQRTRDMRAQSYYFPFRDAVSQIASQPDTRVLITIHSFTRTYMGRDRAVEIGILHDDDSRLADQMLATVGAHTDLNVQRNEPYGPADGVTHTLREHALSGGLLNVMIEVRNDLIADSKTQSEIGAMLSAWLTDAITACSETEPRA